MSYLITKRVLWRLIWFLGIVPLLTTDITATVALSQSSNSKQITQADGNCLEVRAMLESMPINEAVSTIVKCPQDKLNDVLMAVSSVLETSSSTQTRIAALYVLVGLLAPTPESTAPHAIDSLTDDQLLNLLRQVSSLLSAEANQEQTAAARAVGILAVKVIDNQRDLDVTEIVTSSLLPLAVSQNTNSSVEINVRLATLNALRDIGYAIQEEVRQEPYRRQLGQQASLDSDDRWQQNPNRYMTLANRVMDQLIYQFYVSTIVEQEDNALSEELLVSLKEARVEALSAVLLIRSVAADDSESIAADDSRLDTRDAIGIWVLNYLAGNSSEAGAVRATAIASLERLGYQEPFRQLVEKHLRAIAVGRAMYPWLLDHFDPDLRNGTLYETSDELIRALSSAVESGQNIENTENTERRSYWARRRELQRKQRQQQQQQSIRISAVEIMSRVSALGAHQQTQAANTGIRAVPANTALPSINTNSLPSTSASIGRENPEQLFYLLKEGLGSQDTSEIKQRAEIAFAQIYNRDLNRLSEAVAYAGGEGNFDVQRTAVQALGGVNYRRIPREKGEHGDELPPEYLKILTRFLGQSLMCSSNVEVRKEAAYALGQIAPYWPELLKKPLEPYWYNLLTARSSRSFPEALGEICNGSPQAGNVDQEKFRQYRDSHQEQWSQVSVLDALLLRLDDPSEEVIVLVSYALSRYGIALGSEQRRSELLQAMPSQGRGTVRVDNSLQLLKTCMKALISPTRLDRWPSDAPNLELHQPLIHLANGYATGCSPRLLSKRGSNRSATAAAFVLGQVGISDGQEIASPDEQETVEYLLRVLNGRDMLAQRELEPRRNRQAHEGGEPTTDSPDRVDSVRDSIVSYALGQIHPREHELIQLLLGSVTFPDKNPPSRNVGEREKDCAFNTMDRGNNEDAPVCLNHPITRAAVIGALEYIGIEDSSVQVYVRQIRRLLTQDINPSVVLAAIPSVVERVATIVTPPGQTTSNNNVATHPGERRLHVESRSALTATDSRESSVTVQNRLAEARYILSVPYESILSCTGATYALARIGVRDDFTVGQLMNYLYVYPEPLYIPPPNEDSKEASGNLCVPVEATESNGSNELNRSARMLSRVEQLILLKQGAITALGHLDANYANTPSVVRCLVRIANFEPLVPDGDSNGQGCPLGSLDYDVSQFNHELELSTEEPPEPLTEETQAEKWGLLNSDSKPDAAQYYRLKSELREPAIEAVGQLARTETGVDALCALAFGNISVEECSISNAGRIGDNFENSIIIQPQDGSEVFVSQEILPLSYRRQVRSLKLRQIEAAALEFQTSNDPRQRQKLSLIISKFLLPSLSGDNERDLRDDVLRILARLDRASFADLTIDVRTELIQQLGISRQPTGIAKDCLSEETDLLRQEFVCFGAIKLLSSVWLDSFNTRKPTFASAIQFVQELAQPSDEGQTARFSPVIRASAVEAIGQIGRYDLLNQTILFSSFTDDRVAEHVVRAFTQYAPSEVIPSLSRRLQGNDDEISQTADLIRQLGQIVAHPERYEVEVDSSWGEALTQSSLAIDLTRILQNRSTDDLSLRSKVIYALGELRSNDRQAVGILKQTLERSPEPSLRAAAAYALGKIGKEHPEVARLVLPSFYEIVVSEDGVSDELRTSAAYSIAVIGIQSNNFPVNIDRNTIVNGLITVYNNARRSNSDNSEALGAIALYSMSQLGADNEHVAKLFAGSLQSNHSTNIRVIAATYAGDLPRWNEEIVDALIAAVEDSNLTLRFNAILSLGQKPNFGSGGLNEEYREEITTVLSEVFWNEREYLHIRLAAGEVICDLWRPDHSGNEGACYGSTLTPHFNLAFEDVLTNLRAQLGSSARPVASEESNSGGQVTFVVRSSSLANRLDQSDTTTALLRILDDIRAPIVSLLLTGSRNVGAEQSWLCRWFRDSRRCNF